MLVISSCSGFLPQPTPTLTPITTSTETQATYIPPKVTSTSTPHTTSTPRPTITSTPQPEWVASFAQPILNAITNRTPNFQDDFHNSLGGWQLANYCGRWRLEYLNGELILNNCIVSKSNIDYRSYVVEIDGRFTPGTPETGSEWILGTPKFNFSVSYKGSVWIHIMPNRARDDIQLPSTANVGTQNTHIMIIAKRPRYAFYLNGQPLYYLENDIIEWGDFVLQVSNPNQSIGQGDYQTIVAFDNFKIWDISDILIP